MTFYSFFTDCVMLLFIFFMFTNVSYILMYRCFFVLLRSINFIF